jgi:tetratricopeptide (TPR) repeat protein
MLRQTASFVARMIVAIALGKFLISNYGDTPGLSTLAAVFHAACLFLLFGISMIKSVGHRVSQLFWPDESEVRVLPDYSSAEAHFRHQRYEDSIREFRKILEQSPENAYAHVRIADISSEIHHDPKQAEAELLLALTKPLADDGWALAAHRLADLYESLGQLDRALEVMGTLQHKLSRSKHGRLAGQRIEVLNRKLPPWSTQYSEELLGRKV